MPQTTVVTSGASTTTVSIARAGPEFTTTVIVKNAAGNEEGEPPAIVGGEAAAAAASPPIAAGPPGFCVPYELRASAVCEGLGLFATAVIPRGALIWRYAPEIVTEHDEDGLAARIEGCSSDAERVELLEHVYGWDGRIHEILDDGKYWNHSTLTNGQNTGDHPDGAEVGDTVSSYAL